jgi:iron complex outermembrane receptor protein
MIFGARSRIESSRVQGIEYLPELTQKGFMVSDAFLTLEGPKDNWSVTGFVNNIEDKTIKAGSYVRPVLQTVYAQLRPPRTYGLRVNAKF